ncbi:DDE-type integrase/transposase/recombinase [Phormidium tenue FACHB-886]|nr:DDE-type integrase/transposase/recombinase [Phormidium tenue FACHB-886]
MYQGIDEDGNLVDVRLSEKQDMEGVKAFFAQAHEVAEHLPQRVATDGHSSYPRAIEEELGEGNCQIWVFESPLFASLFIIRNFLFPIFD